MLCSSLVVSNANAARPSSSAVSTPHGRILITAKFHASTQIEYGPKVIIVDPVSAASWTKKADLVLITHPHPDHLDLKAIAKVTKPDGFVIAPESVAGSIRKLPGVDVEGWKPGSAALYQDTASNGAKRYLSLTVEAIPMYNLVRGPQAGKRYHPKSNGWNGYVLTLGGKRLYFAGDTEVTPEMKVLKKIDVAFLPMNLPYTMTPAEAAAGAKVFKPKMVYPYHYRFPFDKDSGNETTFARLMRGTKTKVVLLDWYPPAAVEKMMAAMK
jgi:L-ascorbate metabolism protein UlaG (beta-lactamase superfamily)